MSGKALTLGSLVAASAISSAMAFTAVVNQPTTAGSSTALNVAVDPTTVTKKEYEDICGVTFDDDSLMQRLKATNYLYPKHVEVIEDIAPIADVMVDEIVSIFARIPGTTENGIWIACR